ncbi:unsaturated rhamnogalacturonyl hydrolase [Bryocella elongata]|uniref:Unsaturated rhamnogalacturonyl hydrolase n=1 Tax=Bryocella elongata TaxID=863522 RepID=A0A1H6C7Q6_9BACT|nr:glycoside hydrolase family 88 protein [Bryocella elongata]SEG69004.1 unsaturated rhamnogalacturonyl hydrolase [Bryocella elongata]
MSTQDRRKILKLLAGAPLLHSSLACNLAAAQTRSTSPTVDWSEAVVENMMARRPAPESLGGWGYAISLYLYGQYLFYKRHGDRRHLDYIQGWVDRHVDDQGKIDRPITALDYMLPGNLLLVLYKETGKQKYRTAADTIRHTLDTYPRTQDGGIWHALSRQHQLWLDGMFMSMPFLVRYGDMFQERDVDVNEAAKQLLIYAKHLNDPASGLMFHAYDESGQQPWADPMTHHSGFFWCRAIGWFGMALIEVLEVMPHEHPRRGDLIALVRQLCNAYQRYQDPTSGLWYQIVDKGDDPNNWHETSSSSMFTYTLACAVERGYIPRKMASTARKGYAGVLTQLSLDADGHAHIANICEGTNVGDLAFYYGRPRSTDDFHGIGAFLIMNEKLRAFRA